MCMVTSLTFCHLNCDVTNWSRVDNVTIGSRSGLMSLFGHVTGRHYYVTVTSLFSHVKVTLLGGHVTVTSLSGQVTVTSLSGRVTVTSLGGHMKVTSLSVTVTHATTWSRDNDVTHWSRDGGLLYLDPPHSVHGDKSSRLLDSLLFLQLKQNKNPKIQSKNSGTIAE
jgi:hypothetical protein